MKTKLFKYQKQGVKKIEAFNGRALLADSMGLGKTIQALTYYRRNWKKASPCLVVCPANLKYNWQREARIHIGAESEILEGQDPGAFEFGPERKIYIINYDILPYWLDWIDELDPQLVILDECHYIKNRESQRTQASRIVCNKAPHVIGMSGTPLTNRPGELYPMLNIINPKEFDAFMTYAWNYCRPQKKRGKWVYTGHRNLDVLHTQLKRTMMIRRKKEDVLKDLPDKTRSVIPLALNKKESSEYFNAETETYNWISKNFGRHRAKKADKALALTRIGYLKRLASELKLKQVEQWVDDFLETTDEKLIVFGVHAKVLQPLFEKYKKIAVKIDGKTKATDRQTNVDDFQTNKNTRIFFGNIQAAGVGITLTAAATVVFAEMAWSPGEMMQAEDRAHRIGQKNAVNIYYLVANDTIETHLCEVLQNKQIVLESTLDGKESEYEMDLLAMLFARIGVNTNGR